MVADTHASASDQLVECKREKVKAQERVQAAVEGPVQDDSRRNPASTSSTPSPTPEMSPNSKVITGPSASDGSTRSKSMGTSLNVAEVNHPRGNSANGKSGERGRWKRVKPEAPKFLLLLYEILESEDHAVIRWAEDGQSLQILDPTTVTEKILPKYFNHTNFHSFQRQLNYFGFRKWTKSKTDICTFSHPYFRQNQPELLPMIKRKKAPKKNGPEATAATAASSTNASHASMDPSMALKEAHTHSQHGGAAMTKEMAPHQPSMDSNGQTGSRRILPLSPSGKRKLETYMGEHGLVSHGVLLPGNNVAHLQQQQQHQQHLPSAMSLHALMQGKAMAHGGTNGHFHHVNLQGSSQAHGHPGLASYAPTHDGSLNGLHAQGQIPLQSLPPSLHAPSYAPGSSTSANVTNAISPVAASGGKKRAKKSTESSKSPVQEHRSPSRASADGPGACNQTGVSSNGGQYVNVSAAMDVVSSMPMGALPHPIPLLISSSLAEMSKGANTTNTSASHRTSAISASTLPTLDIVRNRIIQRQQLQGSTATSYAMEYLSASMASGSGGQSSGISTASSSNGIGEHAIKPLTHPLLASASSSSFSGLPAHMRSSPSTNGSTGELSPATFSNSFSDPVDILLRIKKSQACASGELTPLSGPASAPASSQPLPAHSPSSSSASASAPPSSMSQHAPTSTASTHEPAPAGSHAPDANVTSLHDFLLGHSLYTHRLESQLKLAMDENEALRKQLDAKAREMDTLLNERKLLQNENAVLMEDKNKLFEINRDLLAKLFPQ